MTDQPATIGEALGAASAYLSAHPDEARYTDSVAIARLESGLRVTVEGPGGERLATDMPPSVGGGGTAPSPGWIFRAALASCVATLAAMRTAQLGLASAGLTVEVDSESDDRGILGLDDSVPAGPLSVRVRISGLSLEEAQIGEIADRALRHCPIAELLTREVPVRLQLGPSVESGDVR